MSNNKLMVQTGTTVFAFKFKQGILIAGDTQASLMSGQRFPVKSKIFKIGNLALACAGGAADAVVLSKVLRYRVSQFNRNTYSICTCTNAANILSNELYSSAGFQVSSILAGYDNQQPKIYGFDGLGFITQQQICTFGSGSRYALAILQQNSNPEMSRQQAVKLANQAMKVSKNLDLYTGFSTTMSIITVKGLEVIQ